MVHVTAQHVVVDRELVRFAVGGERSQTQHQFGSRVDARRFRVLRVDRVAHEHRGAPAHHHDLALDLEARVCQDGTRPRHEAERAQVRRPRRGTVPFLVQRPQRQAGASGYDLFEQAGEEHVPCRGTGPGRHEQAVVAPSRRHCDVGAGVAPTSIRLQPLRVGRVIQLDSGFGARCIGLPTELGEGEGHGISTMGVVVRGAESSSASGSALSRTTRRCDPLGRPESVAICPGDPC